MNNCVLIVEDDPVSRQMLTSMLSEMGLSVTSVSSGDEALQFLYTEEPCDIVLTDIVMPGMSGIELAQRTSDARPGLPLIFVSGKRHAVDAALDAGAVLLPKPVSRASLTNVIGDALGM